MVAFRRRRKAFIVRRILEEFGIENLFSISFSARKKSFQEAITSREQSRKVPSGKFSAAATCFQFAESACIRSQRTVVRQPQKNIVPLSIFNFLFLMSQGRCPRTPSTFSLLKEKVEPKEKCLASPLSFVTLQKSSIKNFCSYFFSTPSAVTLARISLDGFGGWFYQLSAAR